jgi:peptidyl-prolyl cis-trans isomerase SurA
MTGALMKRLTLALMATTLMVAQPISGFAATKPAPKTAAKPLAPTVVKAPDDPDAIGVGAAAIVNDEVISSIDVRQRVVLMVITTGVQPTTQEMVRQIEAQALRGLVDERLQLQEAKRLRVEVKDAEVDEALRGLAAENKMPLSELANELQSHGGSINSLRDQIRAEIAWQRLISGRYGARVRISKEQVDETLKRLSQAADKTQYLISEIVLDTPTEADQAAAMETADRLYQELNKGTPFPVLARQFSTSSSAASGGEVGWVASGELPSEVETVLAQLGPGQISNPIITPDAIRIVALREKRTGEAARTMVALKQAVVPVRGRAEAAETIAAVLNATEKLNALRAKVKSCDSFLSTAKGIAGLSTGEITRIDQAKLALEFQRAVAQLQPGQISEPVRTRVGVHLLMVCNRETVAGSMPEAKDIELRLQNQQLGLLSKRYLRDLRAAATIEGR